MDEPQVLVTALKPVDRCLAAGEDPLSTTQNTRLADAYGSLPITSSTSRPKGTMPVLSSHLPNSLARWTFYATRYCSAPARSYSCSMRSAQDVDAGRVGWQRQRA